MKFLEFDVDTHEFFPSKNHYVSNIPPKAISVLPVFILAIKVIKYKDQCR